MNIWTDIRKERITPKDFVACIEIEQGSKNKYELDIIGIRNVRQAMNVIFKDK